MNKTINKKATNKKNVIFKNKTKIRTIKFNINHENISFTNENINNSKLPVNTSIDYENNQEESDSLRESEILKDTKGFWSLRHSYETRKENAAKRVCLS